MTKPLESDNFYCLEEILAGYVLGNLDEAELSWLNQQLIVNPQLKKQIEQLETTLNLMPYGLPEDFPNANLRSLIFANAQRQSLANSRFSRLGWIISGVTVLSTLWLGWQSYHLRQQLSQVDNHSQQQLITLLSQPNSRLVSFQRLNGTVTSSGSLFLAPESQKAVLALQNLESLSGQQVYRLWAVTQEKKTGCATFTPDEQGKVYLELSDQALSEASSLVITIEPEADTAQPMGNAILAGSYSAI